jgi:hypothetical protein
MSNKYIIKDADGNQINFVVGSEDFVKDNFSSYELWVDPQVNEIKLITARQWRDSELVRTDALSVLTDHPQKTEIAAYRTALRDWPSTSEFPDTKPTLGS